jgi:hypothetical protein
MEVDAMKRLKELEAENARLKKIVANQAVGKRLRLSPGEGPPSSTFGGVPGMSGIV